MFPWAHLQSDGVDPSEKVMTTYQNYFRPLEDHQPRLASRSEFTPAPVFFQHFYKTTNRGYGSPVGSQHPSGSHFPASLHWLGSSNPSEAAGGVGCTLREASAQDASVAMGWREQESNDGFGYQEGVILLYPYVDTIGGDEFLTVLGKEAGPRPLLGPLVVSDPFLTPGQNREAENWQNHVTGWSPVFDLQSSTCSLCGWTPERFGCFETQAVPPHGGLSSTGPPVCGRLWDSGTSLSRKQPLTEYQEKFAAQSDRSQDPLHFPSCYRNLHPSGLFH